MNMMIDQASLRNSWGTHKKSEKNGRPKDAQHDPALQPMDGTFPTRWGGFPFSLVKVSAIAIETSNEVTGCFLYFIYKTNQYISRVCIPLS